MKLSLNLTFEPEPNVAYFINFWLEFVFFALTWV